MRLSSRTKKLKTEEDPLPSTSKVTDRSYSKNANPVGPVAVGGGNAGSSSSHNPTSVPGGVTATGMNPLEIPVILNHLFKLCPAKLLANCRLVSKQWYQESLLTWRTDFPITFITETGRFFVAKCLKGDEDDYDLRVWRSTAVVSNTRLQKFFHYFEDAKNNCLTKPYRFINMEQCEFNLNPGQELWDALGSSLSTLHLSWCVFKDVDQLWKIVFTACPSLGALQVNMCDFSVPPILKTASTAMLEYREPPSGRHKHLKSLGVNADLQRPHQIPWLEYLSRFQSLTYFYSNIDEEDEEQVGEFERLTDAVRAVRKHDPKALPFKCVNLSLGLDISGCTEVSVKQTETVQELRLPIYSLLIEAQPGMDGERLKRILEFQANSVRDIELKMSESEEPSAMLAQPFPFGVLLHNLTCLLIDDELCEDVSFLKYTPSLKILNINGHEDRVRTETKLISNSCKEEMGNLRMAHLLKLTLNYNVSDEDLASLAEWMPNLTSLTIPLNDKQFGIVCRNWRNLTDFVVKGYKLTDLGVTGMSRPRGDEKRTGKKKKAEPRTEPNITDLNSLERFGFYNEDLTEESVFHGFLLLPHLQKVVCPFENPDWGKKARKAMEKRKIVLCELANLDP